MGLVDNLTFDQHGKVTGGYLDKETVYVNGNGSNYITPVGYTLPANAPTGTYQWDAVYSGDANNVGDSFFNDPSEQVLVVAQGTVSGTVYCDKNLNGAFDTGDVGDAGAMVTVTGTDY